MMPNIKKRSRASRNQPEQELSSIANRMSSFLAANRNILTAIAAGLAAVVLIAAIYSLKRSRDERNAAPLLASAYEAYERADASGGADYAKALDLFQSVQKKYPSSMSGATAAYYVGNCLMNLGRNDDALKEYQAFVKEYGNNKFLLGLVFQRMGYLHRKAGREADAAASFEKADALTGPGLATIELARFYESAGKTAESEKKYKMIADKLPGTAWSFEAMGKVQKIQPPPQTGPAGQAK
jgi:tetratricopeptide (TPR) repeat protein